MNRLALFSLALLATAGAVSATPNEASQGNGQEALAAAVGELGKGCGGCHKAFRAKDY
jgi:cytochrome c556